MNFCPDCGLGVEARIIEGKSRAFCVRCDRTHYRQPIVGAGGLIEIDGRLLLILRKNDPFVGCWGLPAGYVDEDEPPASAVRREVSEETGLDVRVSRLVDAYFFDDHPRGSGIFLVYRCEVIGGELVETEESATPTFFARDRMPEKLAGSGHSLAVQAWSNGA